MVQPLQLGVYKLFQPTLYWTCDYLSMLVLKLKHINQSGPRKLDLTGYRSTLDGKLNMHTAFTDHSMLHSFKKRLCIRILYIYIYIYIYINKDCSYISEARRHGISNHFFLYFSHDIPVLTRESLNNRMSLYSKFSPPTCILLFVISAVSRDTQECWIKQTFEYGRSVLPETGDRFNITLDVSYLDLAKSRWRDNSV